MAPKTTTFWDKFPPSTLIQFGILLVTLASAWANITARQEDSAKAITRVEVSVTGIRGELKEVRDSVIDLRIKGAERAAETDARLQSLERQIGQNRNTQSSR